MMKWQIRKVTHTTKENYKLKNLVLTLLNHMYD